MEQKVRHSPQPSNPDYREDQQDGRDNEVRQGITGQNVRYVLGVGLATVIIVMILIGVFALRG